MITRDELKEVSSKYREIENYSIEDIVSGDEDIKEDSIVYLSDFEDKINKILEDVGYIIKSVEAYDVLNAIDDLKLLESKLY